MLLELGIDPVGRLPRDIGEAEAIAKESLAIQKDEDRAGEIARLHVRLDVRPDLSVQHRHLMGGQHRWGFRD